MVALGDVVDFCSGGTPSKANPDFWRGDVPWFSAKDIKQPRLADSADHISQSVFDSTSIRKIPAGTVVMVVRGMILAHTVPVAILDVESAVNQDLKALIPRREVDPRFLAAMLRAQHDAILAQVSTAAHGTKKLDARVLENIQIPFPPLDEQRRVAAILDQADALRTRRRQTLAHLDDLTQSIFQRMFEGDDLLRMSAGELMPAMRNGLSPATAGQCSATVLTLSAVTRGRFDPTAVKPGMFASEPPVDKRVSGLDFLMCRGNGNKALVGVGTFSRDDRPDLVFPDTVIAGRIDPSLVSMAFLEAAWRQKRTRSQIEALARTTNGTYKVNQQSLATVEIPVPPLTSQQEFAARAGCIQQQRGIMESELANLDDLFASLQHQAFRGEL